MAFITIKDLNFQVFLANFKMMSVQFTVIVQMLHC